MVPSNNPEPSLSYFYQVINNRIITISILTNNKIKLTIWCSSLRTSIRGKITFNSNCQIKRSLYRLVGPSHQITSLTGCHMALPMITQWLSKEMKLSHSSRCLRISRLFSMMNNYLSFNRWITSSARVLRSWGDWSKKIRYRCQQVHTRKAKSLCSLLYWYLPVERQAVASHLLIWTITLVTVNTTMELIEWASKISQILTWCRPMTSQRLRFRVLEAT